MTARFRSLLTAPASRPDLMDKAPRSGPDAVFLDLEDGVPPGAKVSARPDARAAAESLLADHPKLLVFVRVNGLSTPWFHDDVAEALPPGLTGVVVPKLESSADVDAAVGALDGAGLGGLRLMAGIESAAGVARVEEVLRAPVAWCYFGAEDYVADLGGARTPENLEVLYARSRVALAARVAGVHAIDQIVADLRDETRYVHDAEQGRALGYQGKLCIHPAQVALAHQVFTPSSEEVERARRLLAAYDAAAAEGEATIDFEGEMVDEPMARRARATLAAVGDDAVTTPGSSPSAPRTPPR
jgi:citrate lyase subunit beta/citryl-CoA lyase